MNATPPQLKVSQLTLYNPSRLTDAEIDAAFVVRKAVFDRVLGEIAEEKPSSRAQHHLIVGQRGMGKTMLLARLASELRTSPELANRFVPLVFAEEQYAVDRLSRFWLNCLDALADAADRAGDTSISKQIDTVVRKLEQQPGGTAEKDESPAREALDAFLQAAERIGKRPVLLVDNLQLVFDRIAGVQQHALREVLMRPGSPILVGASPSSPSTTQDYGAAFYDHFKNHYVQTLSADEMRGLVLKLAERTDRTDVRDKVQAHPERLKTLRDLTGGNPRTVVMLFLLFAEDCSTTVVADLENLLDRVTPLYKARIEELSEQQQVVVSAIADIWEPVTTRALSERISLPTASVSGQLDRLEKLGWVEKVELFGETSAGFQIAERFFNVWFLMRSASRRRRREIEFLVRFIEAFYEAEDRPRLAEILMNERDYGPTHYQLARALARTVDSYLGEWLARHADLDILHQKKTAESRRKLEEVIDFSALPAATLAFDELREKLKALMPGDAVVTSDEFTVEVLGDRQMFVCGDRDRLAAAAGPLSNAKIIAILKSIRDSRERDEAEYGKSAVSWFRAWLAIGQLRSLHDREDWDRCFLSVPTTDETNAFQLLVDSVPRQVASELSDEARKRIQDSLSPGPDSDAQTWAAWGLVLRFKLGWYPESAAAYRKAIELEPKLSYAWNGLGNLYCDHLQRYSDAAKAFKKALEYGFDESARENLVFLYRDFLADMPAARESFAPLQAREALRYKDSFHLHEALFAAYDANWGLCTEALARSLDAIGNQFSPDSDEDWWRASAVLLHLNYGAELLAFLRERGDDARLRPWYEALAALHQGDRRYLQNIPVEVRTTAEFYFDQIEKRLNALPEKTRRRPVPKPSKKSRKR